MDEWMLFYEEEKKTREGKKNELFENVLIYLQKRCSRIFGRLDDGVFMNEGALKKKTFKMMHVKKRRKSGSFFFKLVN